MKNTGINAELTNIIEQGQRINSDPYLRESFLLFSDYDSWVSIINEFLDKHRINSHLRSFLYESPLKSSYRPRSLTSIGIIQKWGGYEEKVAERVRNGITQKLNYLEKLQVELLNHPIKKIAGEEPIKILEFVTNNMGGSSLDLVVNEDYTNPVVININMKNWGKLFNLAKTGIGPSKEGGVLSKKDKNFFDYFNGKRHKLVTNSKYQQSQLLTIREDSIVPNIKIETITRKQFELRKNKMAA